jgi:hypothetical protein
MGWDGGVRFRVLLVTFAVRMMGMDLPLRRRGTSSSKEEMVEKERRELFRRRSSGKPDEKKYHERCIDSVSKLLSTKVFLLICTFLVLVYCQLIMTDTETQPDVEPMDYEHNGDTLRGYLALPDESEIAYVQSYPAVIIIP